MSSAFPLHLLAGTSPVGNPVFDGSTSVTRRRWTVTIGRIGWQLSTAACSRGAHRNWHGSLPAPRALFDRTSFAVSGDEAEFLAERIRRSAADSLLAACLAPGIGRVRAARAPWDLRGLENPPPVAPAAGPRRREALLPGDGRRRPPVQPSARGAGGRTLRHYRPRPR